MSYDIHYYATHPVPEKPSQEITEALLWANRMVFSYGGNNYRISARMNSGIWLEAVAEPLDGPEAFESCRLIDLVRSESKRVSRLTAAIVARYRSQS